MLRVQSGRVAKLFFPSFNFLGEGAKSDGDNASLRVSSRATYSDRCLPRFFVDKSSEWTFASKVSVNDTLSMGNPLFPVRAATR